MNVRFMPLETHISANLAPEPVPLRAFVGTLAQLVTLVVAGVRKF